MGTPAQPQKAPTMTITAGPSLLAGHVREYAWGSHHHLATIQGRRAPTPRPEAELWFGAHEAGPATIAHPDAHVALDAAIAADPDGMLGPVTAARFGHRLPFLLKLLAAARPLSLQVHPDGATAAAGFAAEEHAAIPRTHPDRCYPDPWPKPELLRAVTPFAALCGFRPAQRTLDLLATLALPGTDWMAQTLRDGGDAALPQLVGRLLGLARPQQRQLLDALRAAPTPSGATGSEWARTQARIAALDAAYPDDPGVLVALLLELHELSPGEAIQVPPGTPHAYLEGVGVEVMAASDNVLRGGLTTKHVDTDGFVAGLAPHGTSVGRAPTRQVRPGHLRHGARNPYFQLHEYRDLPGAPVTHSLAPDGPAIVLCLDGQAALGRPGSRVTVPAGQAAFLPARAAPCQLRVEGTAVVATAGDGHLDGYPMGV